LLYSDQLQSQYDNLASAHLVPVTRCTEDNLSQHIKGDVFWRNHEYYGPGYYLYRYSRDTYEPVKFLNDYWHFLRIYTGQPHIAPEFCLEPYARGTGYWHTYDYQHPEYQHFTRDLFKNIAVDSIHKTAHYKFGRQLEEANKEAEERYICIPRPTAKTPVLVVETAGVSTLSTDPTISPFITAQVVHSPQFTEPRTHEETPSTDKPSPEQVEPEEPSPEQEGHKEPDLEVHFEQALDIHEEPVQLAPQLILPAPQQVTLPMAQQAQQPAVLTTN
jgi:hypothetical protein